MDSTNKLDFDVLTFEFNPKCRKRRLLPCPTQRPHPHRCLASISATGALINHQKDGHTNSKALLDKPTSTKTSAPSSSSLPPGTVLPVSCKQGGHYRKLVWDGHRLIPTDPEDVPSVVRLAIEAASGTKKYHTPDLAAILRTAQARAARWAHDVHAAFFPNPSEVTPDYWEYVKWRGCHRFFSSMSSIFATQSLLLAVGVGAKRSLPAAATINWVLKDGLGRLGRLTVATRFGESFDSDLKRFRFASSLLYATALALDYLTPIFPAHFLPLAALANVGKSVGLTTYISTQPAFHRSFARSENLADISAKAQAQQMAVDTVGLALAVTLSALCRSSDARRRALPLIAFPFLVTGDLISIYKELRSIHLRTLNKERAELIAEEWLRAGKAAVPTPRQVSARERLIFPPDAAVGPLPLTLGGLEGTLISADDVEVFAKKGDGGRNFVVAVDLPSSSKSSTHISTAGGMVVNNTTTNKNNKNNKDATIFHRKKGRGAVRATLRGDASANDVLEVVLQVAHMRKALGDGTIKHGDRDGDGASVVRDASDAARKELPVFVKQLHEAGWQMTPFMLSSSEKSFYWPHN